MDEPIAWAYVLNLELIASSHKSTPWRKLTPIDLSMSCQVKLSHVVLHDSQQTHWLIISRSVLEKYMGKKQWKQVILPWPPRVRKGIRLMAMGTVPCLLWKWWTWWVVLREEETLAATAGQGNTSNARESTSLNRKAGLAHTAGDAATGLGTSTNPPSTSTSTSCSMGVGPEMNKRPLPLVRHKQEESISNESRSHDPLLSSLGRKQKCERKYGLKKKANKGKKKILVWKSQKWLERKNEWRKKIQNPSWKKYPPKNPPTVLCRYPKASDWILESDNNSHSSQQLNNN